MEEIFVNKVANSGLISLNLEDYYSVGERVEIDVKGEEKMKLSANHLFDWLN